MVIFLLTTHPQSALGEEKLLKVSLLNLMLEFDQRRHLVMHKVVAGLGPIGAQQLSLAWCAAVNTDTQKLSGEFMSF